MVHWLRLPVVCTAGQGRVALPSAVQSGRIKRKQCGGCLDILQSTCECMCMCQGAKSSMVLLTPLGGSTPGIGVGPKKHQSLAPMCCP